MTAPEPLDVIEALHTTPARRYLSDTPIADEVIWEILDAAVRGPSGGNRQGWGWVVVTDPAVKKPIAELYRDAWDAAYGQRREEILGGKSGDTLSPRSFLAADHLAAHIEEAPVWVFPVLRNAADATSPTIGASIYGAVQQLMLAARAYGIGTTLTSLHTRHEAEVAAVLGLPPDARTMALIPLGYPARGRWAEPKRLPLGDVVHWDRWGVQRPRPDRT